MIQPCSLSFYPSVTGLKGPFVLVEVFFFFFSMVELFIHRCFFLLFLSDMIYSVAILYKPCSCPIKCSMFSSVLQQS